MAGLLDYSVDAQPMGLLSPQEMKTARAMSLLNLAGDMVSGDFGGGLKSAGNMFQQMQDTAIRRHLAALQMQEAQGKLADQQRQRDFLNNLPSPQFQAGQAALAGGGGPTVQNAARIAPVSPMQDLLYQGTKAGAVPLGSYIQALQPKAPIKVGEGDTLLDAGTYKPIFNSPKTQTLPSAIQEYQFAKQQGFPGTFEQWQISQKKAGATNVSVGVNTDKSYFSNVAEAMAKNDAALIEAARTAPDRIQTAQRVKDLLAQNPITGTGAEMRLSLNKALATGGLIDGKNVADTETLASTLASQTLDAIKTSGLGSGQGFTDKDRQFLERARSGNIEMNPITLGRLADLNERSARVTIQRGNTIINKLRSSPESGKLGQILDPIQEPTKAPSKAPVRRGMYQGRPVIQYSDGPSNMPIDPKLVQWQDPAGPAIDPAAIQWETPGNKFDLRGEMYDRAMNYDPTNAQAGMIRGAGSIGATVLRPFESGQQNAQRRTDMDAALRDLMRADPSSTQYQTNKLLAEVAGTSGVGGLVAKGVRMIPGAARALPTLLPAIESGGMAANGARGIYGVLNRIAGGAVNGAATAGLANPEDAGAGMMIGGALPPAVQLVGGAGQAVGSRIGSKAINPQLAETARQSVEAGYVIPPNMVKPSLGSQVIESISGKQATQQIASVKNSQTTEKLVRNALGIADDIPLSKGTMENLRKTAGQAYAEVAQLSPQAAADLEALKQARNDAQSWFKAYNRSASPADLAKAKEYREMAQSLETWLEYHAAEAGKSDLIPKLQQARKEIAKIYTVERALNDAAGTVDARVLGRMYEKRMPLGDGLDTAGRFASAFPTIAKAPQQIGSPAAHNLKAGMAMLLGGGGAGAGAALGMGGVATGGLGALGAAVPFVAPPIARSIMFSKGMQRGLLDTSPGLLGNAVDEALPLMYRISPLLGASGS